MYRNKRILAIIPARGGSKRLPGKNIKILCGKPLIGWTIEQAKSSKYIDDIFVSTDYRSIADIAEQFGIKVPFLRPEELSKDSSSSMDVVEHVLKVYKRSNQLFDFIILLEPTSPLRKKGDIDSAIEILFDNQEADGIISLGEIHLEHPMIVKRINKIGRLVPYFKDIKKIYQRQQADKAYFPYGVIYMVKTTVFEEKKAFYTENVIPFLIERWQNYEIDDQIDFEIIEVLLNTYKSKIF